MRNLVWIIALIALGCNDSGPGITAAEARHDQNTTTISDTVQEIIQPSVDTTRLSGDQQIQTPISILILPCSNGYDYATAGYDFGPLLTKELNRQDGIAVLEFPFKTLQNMPYYGIYDKKHCDEIVKKVKCDFILMSKFAAPTPEVNSKTPFNWGYEIKILNTKTMNQMTSIGADELPSYKEIENDIRSKMNVLVEHLQTKI
jgi:hypothetical protein